MYQRQGVAMTRDSVVYAPHDQGTAMVGLVCGKFIARQPQSPLNTGVKRAPFLVPNGSADKGKSQKSVSQSGGLVRIDAEKVR